jgi:hypothetical protein
MEVVLMRFIQMATSKAAPLAVFEQVRSQMISSKTRGATWAV